MPTRRTNALAALLASSSLLLASAVALPAQSFPPPGGNDQGQGSPATSQAAADTALTSKADYENGTGPGPADEAHPDASQSGASQPDAPQSGASQPDGAEGHAPEEGVRIIVQFADEASESDCDKLVDRIGEAVAASVPAAAGGPAITRARDYRNVFTGVAIDAPAASLPVVQGVDGVKSAFIEREGHIEGDESEQPGGPSGNGGPAHEAGADGSGSASAAHSPSPVGSPSPAGTPPSGDAASSGDGAPSGAPASGAAPSPAATPSQDAAAGSGNVEGGADSLAAEGIDPSNRSAHLMMRMDHVSHKGEGRVIAFLDTGLEVAHPAFSGAVDASKTALKRADVEQALPRLGEGKDGHYVNDKIPFAYDYADDDADVAPSSGPGGFHGTHVAGIAAANADRIRGTAPGAQIIVAKVARSGNGSLPDSAVLAALDDMAVLRPDVVNLSIGWSAGMDNAADSLYSTVYASLQGAGVTVNAAAGNSYSAGRGNRSGKNLPYASDPDSSVMDEPATYSSAVAVASVDNAPANGAYRASDFSAWGVSPDLRLKPEIASPGGGVVSAVPGGAYDQASGTSMATPQMAGISAIVLERVSTDPLFAGMSAAERTGVAQSLIMGTAHPLVDADQGTGVFYSPRKQGAGLVDALAATTSPVYPTVDGAAEPSRPKADLGDGTAGWSFTITVHNLSDSAKSYALSSQALSEAIEGGLFTLHSTDWRGKGVSVSYSGAAVAGSGEGATLTVPASGRASVTVSVAPGAAFASYASANAPKGTFIDGFVRLAAQNGSGPDLSVPYLGFYGSWGAADVFDAKASDAAVSPAHIYPSAFVDSRTGRPLGANPLAPRNTETVPDPGRYVVSRAASSLATRRAEPRTGLLRSVHTLTSTYANEAGATVREYTNYQNYKSVRNANGTVSRAESYHLAPVFDSEDQVGAGLPDGKYTLTIAATTSGPSPTRHAISYDFALDTTAPRVTVRGVIGEGAGAKVAFDVTDASPLAAFDFHDPSNGTWYYRELVNDDGTVNPDGSHTYHFEVSASALQAAWEAQRGKGAAPSQPYVLAWDWGVNPSDKTVVRFPGTTSGAWTHDSHGWWYRLPDGSWPSSTSMVIDGETYRFDASGYMRTGWVGEAGSWYYHLPSGAMAKGWAHDSGSWYYLSPGTGAMTTGWLKQGSTWYYLTASGAMATGWTNVGGTWYYFSSSGAMATGWLKVGGTWYYLAPSGAMATGWTNIDGTWYYFSSSGAWTG